MFSVAVSLFNIERMDFQWASALNNFLDFGDELVINLNKSEDDTEKLVQTWATEARTRTTKPVNVFLSDFAYDLSHLDGLCKNNAIQNCTHQFIILVDIDERLIISQRKQWERLALEYIQKDKTDTILIPSINCWGSEEKAKNIGQKWYIQRQGIRRGVVDFARNKDGTFNIEKSDGTEPIINKEGNLARSLAVVPPQISDYEKLMLIKQNDLPYVIHLGDVDFEKRIKRNEHFWKNQWTLSAGREVTNLATDVEQMKNVTTFEHGLKIKNEVDIPTTVAAIEEKEKLVEGHVHGLEF